EDCELPTQSSDVATPNDVVPSSQVIEKTHGIPKSSICSCCDMVMDTVKKGKPDLKNKVMLDVVVRQRKFREVEVYVETGVLVVEKHPVERMTKIDHEFGLDNSSRDEQDVSNDVDFDDVSFDDVDFDVADFDVVMDDLDLHRSWKRFCIMPQMIALALVERKDGPYHNVDEPEEINDIFADLDQALDELHQVIEAQETDVEDGDVIPAEVYDAMVAQEMLKDQAGDMISVEVVAKDKVAEEIIMGSCGKDGDVLIPREVYAVMVAVEGFLYIQHGDVVNPTKVYDAMVAQEMLEY
nr:hypothetical protein [Tanacetum cinerariifolium]